MKKINFLNSEFWPTLLEAKKPYAMYYVLSYPKLIHKISMACRGQSSVRTKSREKDGKKEKTTSN